ncbi:BRCA1-associated protein isoform 2 [Schistosoma japonicum]|uniref:BRCA1-associated protein isoform 2 n=3 Tax=Schistosoma japonicum TaxID=6182 RepID=A0A4Z2CRY2_SCHJA|nr:BRCA1-associated protein isoform 2 [Schistosoma japonicum]
MNTQSLYHLVVLFEETKPRLSKSISYRSPSLPYPFIIRKPLKKFRHCSSNTSDIQGSRQFNQIIVETMNISELCDIERCGEISFYSGNPTVETTEGIIHIYKNQREVPRCDGMVTSTMLCFFSVPSHITVKDLLRFISPMRNVIEELRIVKDGTPNRYMALLKFRTPEDTDHFYDAYNSTCYNTLEQEVCQLMYVSHVEITHPSIGVAFPTKDLRELPSCPVCLERLDEPVQGILTTILCNHTFHDGCISQVEDTICPVCRYVQSPEILADSQCADCDIRQNLWICLICGHVGCGRYGQKHAQLHFEETGHTFALELGKTLVWDYADDAYVHRLAVNHEDGKLVQLGPNSESGSKKLDLITMEFSAILTSQLESQRAYFESQLDSVTTQSNERLEEMESRVESALSAARTAEDKLSEIIKENGVISRKLQQATSLAQRLQKDLEEERALNKSLLINEKTWRERTEQAESEAKTAREECRELLLNLELRDKLKEIGTNEELTKDELESCEISLQSNNSQKSNRRRRKR